MAGKKIKRIIWVVIVSAILVACAFRAWEWLEPWRIGQERFEAYVQR